MALKASTFYILGKYTSLFCFELSRAIAVSYLVHQMWRLRHAKPRPTQTQTRCNRSLYDCPWADVVTLIVSQVCTIQSQKRQIKPTYKQSLKMGAGQPTSTHAELNDYWMLMCVSVNMLTRVPLVFLVLSLLFSKVSGNIVVPHISALQSGFRNTRLETTFSGFHKNRQKGKSSNIYVKCVCLFRFLKEMSVLAVSKCLEFLRKKKYILRKL